MSKGKKAQASDKMSDEPKPKITTVKLYHPNTVEHPNKIIYSSGEEYIKSIDDLAKVITDYGRENGNLVPFVIEKIKNKVFLINCSNLYIVGYQNKEENKLFAFKEDELRYTSKTAYKFKDIKEKSIITEDLHTLGYMVAEALRSTFIKDCISKHSYYLDIGANILDHKIESDKTDEQYDICRKILEKLTIKEIAHSFAKSNEDEIAKLKKELKALAIPQDEKTKLILDLEKLDPEKLFGLKYLEGSQFPECGEYTFDHSELGYDVYNLLGEN